MKEVVCFYIACLTLTATKQEKPEDCEERIYICFAVVDLNREAGEHVSIEGTTPMLKGTSDLCQDI